MILIHFVFVQTPKRTIMGGVDSQLLLLLDRFSTMHIFLTVCSGVIPHHKINELYTDGK